MNAADQLQGMVKLSGAITNYKCTRAKASFIFTDSDRTQLGVVAIAAGVAGLSGQAIATASYAASTEEEADYVEFDLDGKPVKGWVWRSPFKEGDQVEVAGEWRDGHYEAGAITRPSDRMIALYPHCARGATRHIKNAAKWWFIGVSMWVLAFALVMLVITGPNDYWILVSNKAFSYALIGSYAFFGIMTISLARKWMPFVRLTERVCRTLGIPDAGNVDLVKSSKAQRKSDDPGEYGTFYFRY